MDNKSFMVGIVVGTISSIVTLAVMGRRKPEPEPIDTGVGQDDINFISRQVYHANNAIININKYRIVKGPVDEIISGEIHDIKSSLESITDTIKVVHIPDNFEDTTEGKVVPHEA